MHCQPQRATAHAYAFGAYKYRRNGQLAKLVDYHRLAAAVAATPRHLIYRRDDASGEIMPYRAIHARTAEYAMRKRVFRPTSIASMSILASCSITSSHRVAGALEGGISTRIVACYQSSPPVCLPHAFQYRKYPCAYTAATQMSY